MTRANRFFPRLLRQRGEREPRLSHFMAGIVVVIVLAAACLKLAAGLAE